jgi:hypothetical protein
LIVKLQEARRWLGLIDSVKRRVKNEGREKEWVLIEHGIMVIGCSGFDCELCEFWVEMADCSGLDSLGEENRERRVMHGLRG